SLYKEEGAGVGTSALRPGTFRRRRDDFRRTGPTANRRRPMEPAPATASVAIMGATAYVYADRGVSTLACRPRISETPGMKRPLRKLPLAKQRELDAAVEIIQDGFARAISTRRADRLKNGRILKIILFGSYARGDWVHDPVGRYFSDFDLLVVVDHEDLTDFEFWEDVEKRLLAELSA